MRIERLEIKGFGKLKDLVITPEDGLNVLYGDNEAGKSTLQAFILGMLYGLKNGRQAPGSAGSLRRYEPWDGGAYGGALVCSLDNGSTYRIERNFKAGTIKVFDDCYSDITGDFGVGRDKMPLIAERLLGMDESTFTRTSFIRQMELRLDENASEALAGRLANVASTGIEDVSLNKAEKAISDALKNGVGTERTRIQPLDRLEARLAQLQEASGRLIGQQERTFSAVRELQDARERLRRLEAGEKYLKDIRRLIELRRTLDGFMKKEAALEDTARQLKEAEAAGARYLAGPGSNGAEVILRRNRSKGSGKGLKLSLISVCTALVCFLTLFAAGLAGVKPLPLPPLVCAIGAFVSAVAGIALNIYKNVKFLKFKPATASNPEYPEVSEADVRKEMTLREASLACGRQLESPAAIDRELRGVASELERLSMELEAGIEAAAASEYDSQGHFNRGVLDTVIYDSDIAGLDEAWEAEIKEVKQERLDASLKIKYCEGLLGGDREIPDELAALTEETIAVKEKITYLKNKGDALRLALEVLNEAGAEIRQNFAPDVNQRMSRIISGLSAGKYSDLRGNDRLSLGVALPDSGDVRSVLSLSGGTGDQVYLALRLALSSLLTEGGESLPLIFDEVFAQFDDRRTSLALQYLHNIYFSKQILIFTCKQREIELAQEIYGEGMNLVRLEYERTAC